MQAPFKKTPEATGVPISRTLLLEALQERRFHPYFQAIVDADGAWQGAEMLMRWLHPDTGVLSPALFLGRLEEEKLLLSATRQMLEHALAAWRQASIDLPAPFFLSFNACCAQLQGDALVSDCKAFMQGLDAPRLTLMIEMPERGADLSPGRCAMLFEQCVQEDIAVAVDDFGVGDARLHQLACGQISCLKLDRSFVMLADSNSMYSRLIEKIVALAAACGAQVTAEGVETRSQLRLLERMGVRLFQGYHFCKPLPAEAFFRKMSRLAAMPRQLKTAAG